WWGRCWNARSEGPNEENFLIVSIFRIDGGGANLSRPPGALDRAVPARRRDRHPRAHRGAEDDRVLGRGGGGGEPRRGGGRDRLGGGSEGRARRLHDPDGDHLEARREPGDQSEAALRHSRIL